MKEDSTLNRGQQRRLERAVKHCSDYWLPINRELAQEILDEFQRSDGECGPIAKLLKKDLGLFTLCFREVSELLKQEGREMSLADGAASAFQDVGAEALFDIIEAANKSINTHTLANSSDIQFKRFQEMLTSAATASTLAERFALDEESCYSAAVIRQLGIALIAWNYPSVYQEAITNSTIEVGLEERIARKLGFSPSTLATKLLHTWGYNHEQCSMIGLSLEMEGEEQFLGQALTEVCRIGEALARASQPETYPKAREDWFFAEEALKEQLGGDALEQVKEKLQELQSAYDVIAPEIFLGDPLNVAQTYFENASSPDSVANPYLDCCSPHLRTFLSGLYRELNSTTYDQTEALKKLLHEGTKQAGMRGGCVYTVDTGIMYLIPQFQFGKTELRDIKSVDYSLSYSQRDEISVAFQSHEPIISYGSAPDGKDLMAVSTLFGRSQRVGVFYVELPACYTEAQAAEVDINVRALVHALCDSLGLM